MTCPNKSIKELKAENKELAGELKNRMFAEAEKQNEESKRLKRETRAVGRKWQLKQKMAQTGLFEKVKESYLKKDVDRGLEAC